MFPLVSPTQGEISLLLSYMIKSRSVLPKLRLPRVLSLRTCSNEPNYERVYLHVDDDGSRLDLPSRGPLEPEMLGSRTRVHLYFY